MKSVLISSNKRKCILVAGMHRSGTSLVMGILQILGVELGTDLLVADEFNEKGYFENRLALGLNEGILARMGLSWHTSYQIDERWQESEIFEWALSEVRNFLRLHFKTNKIFGIKDPRLSILFPVWSRALEDEGIEHHTIVLIRHPLEVERSLKRAHSSIDFKAILLWIDYNLRIERYTRGSHRAYLDFEDLMEFPTRVTEIFHKLAPEILISTKSTDQKLKDFVEADLRHQIADLNKSDEATYSASEVWLLLQHLPEDNTTQIHAKLDQYYSRHLDNISNYGYVFARTNDNLISQLEQLNQKVCHDLKIGSKELNLVSNKFTEGRKTLLKVSDSLDELRNTIIHSKARVLDLQELLNSSGKEIEHQKQLVRQYQEEETYLNQFIAHRNESFEKEINAKNLLIDQLQKEGNRYLQEVENLRNDLFVNQSTLREVQGQFLQLRTHCENLEKDNYNIRKSVSFRIGWILTRPAALISKSRNEIGILGKVLGIVPYFILVPFKYPIQISRALTNSNFRKLVKALKEEPKVSMLKNIDNFLRKRNPPIQYATPELSRQERYSTFLSNTRYSKEQVEAIRNDSATLHFRPLISIVTPVYNTDPIHLDRCILSVINQYYEKWELCIHDDCSTSLETINCLKKWAVSDDRIKISYGQTNRHISQASNDAISLAVGEYIGLLDHDDEITPDALYLVVSELNRNPDCDFIYSDEDKIELDDTLADPHFKSDFNLDLFLSHNYICHFSVIRKSLGDEVGWFRVGFEGAQDYDLFLRLIDRTRRIIHIKKVLYHWRKTPQSTALIRSNKDYVNHASEKALIEYMERNNINGQLCQGLFDGSWRIKRNVNPDDYFVSIIIPFKDQVDLLKHCLESIIQKTQYLSYEIILVSNNSEELDTFKFLDEVKRHYQQIRVFEYNVPFNFSQINNWAVEKAAGEAILFLNNDTEVISIGWLTALVEHIQREEVGAVGAKLYYPDMTIQHAGVVIGIGGVAGHVHNNLPSGSLGYFGRASITQNLSACTAACLMVKRSVFMKIGGFEEDGLKVAFNDIDLCLKIRELGYLVVYTPFCELYHHESVSRGYEDTQEKKARFDGEVRFFRERWSGFLDLGDPYYNLNLDLDRTDFQVKI